MASLPAPAAASGSFNPQSAAAGNRDANLRRHLPARDFVQSGCAAFTAVQSPWATRAPVRKDGDIRVFEELQFAHNAIAAAIPAFSARAFADVVRQNPHRVLVLESFYGRVPAIRHVGVGRGPARAAR